MNTRAATRRCCFPAQPQFRDVFFDRQALNVLMPPSPADLMLTQTQIGLIAGGLSFTWAIAAFFVGMLSDTLGQAQGAPDRLDDRVFRCAPS